VYVRTLVPEAVDSAEPYEQEQIKAGAGKPQRGRPEGRIPPRRVPRGGHRPRPSQGRLIGPEYGNICS
jgi:hypothetical protein